MQASELVRTKRKAFGMSQKEFAELLGLKQNGERTIREWENEEQFVNDLLNKGDKNLQHKYIKLMNDWESDNPNWMNNDVLVEEYAEISKKVYQDLDDNKYKADLIKEVMIPK